MHSILGIPPSAVAGGVLIGLGAVFLYLALGRIAGISGIFFGALRRQQDHTSGAWRWTFLLGLMGGAILVAALTGEGATLGRPPVGAGWLIAAGLLVGWGTRMGNGCTSGHGVCGLGRLSLRSLAAVAAFMTLGVLTASLFRHWLGVPA